MRSTHEEQLQYLRSVHDEEMAQARTSFEQDENALKEQLVERDSKHAEILAELESSLEEVVNEKTAAIENVEQRERERSQKLVEDSEEVARQREAHYQGLLEEEAARWRTERETLQGDCDRLQERLRALSKPTSRRSGSSGRIFTKLRPKRMRLSSSSKALVGQRRASDRIIRSVFAKCRRFLTRATTS